MGELSSAREGTMSEANIMLFPKKQGMPMDSGGTWVNLAPPVRHAMSEANIMLFSKKQRVLLGLGSAHKNVAGV